MTATGTRRLTAVFLLSALAVSAVAATPETVVGAGERVFEGPVARAECDKGARPEPDLQGEVTVAERDSGSSEKGYWCNLELVGSYLGEGASWQAAFYKHCGYYDTKLAGGQQTNGTIVVDASDRSKPEFSTNLTTVAMLDPWESLKVNDKRGLLAGVAVTRPQSGVPTTGGVGFFDVYDLNADCAKPELKASTAANLIGHEGEWAPDGLTYYGSSWMTGTLTAIDVTDPADPRPVGVISQPLMVHGLSVSDDGNRLYLAHAANGEGGNGLTILDSSQVQSREPNPEVPTLGSVTWDDGGTAQHTIPVTIKGHPYVIFVDEGGYGAVRIIDVADETAPKVIAKLKLEIHMEANRGRAVESAAYGRGGGFEGEFGYNAHYCGVPRRANPRVLGCSFFESGVRVFDIRDPHDPREIAYFNVGGNGTQPAPGSHRSGGTSAYSSSLVRILPKRGEVWFSDQDKGLYITRFTRPLKQLLKASESW